MSLGTKTFRATEMRYSYKIKNVKEKPYTLKFSFEISVGIHHTSF